VGVLSACLAVRLLFYATMLPLWEGYDEWAHFAYIQHIVGSLQSTVGTAATPGPDETAGDGATPPVETPAPGQVISYTFEYCQNQHGQGIAGGQLTNNDSVPHLVTLIVEFYQIDTTKMLNDTRSYEYDMPAGQSREWQAVVSSGLPSVDVSCKVREIQVR